MSKSQKHIVIDARIRKSSTGRPVDRLLEYLQQLESDNTYTVVLVKDDDWRPKNRRFTVVHSRFPIFSLNPFQQILYAHQLRKLAPDLVFFTMSGQQPIFYFGKQITFTHDMTMMKYARAGRLPGWLHALRMQGYRFLMWQGHKKATKILVPSEYVREAVLKYHVFTQRKVVVTYEAAEPVIEGEVEPVEGVRSPFIMHVGSPFPHKNIRRLIKAFEKLREKTPELTLVLAGRREYYFKKLESWVRERESYSYIRFTGFVSDAQLKWLYQNAECYVLPSLSEGFGLPGLEAMAHDCPLVSSNSTCLPEIYGKAAEYFDPYDLSSMQRAISKVLSGDKLRKELINKGHVQIKKYSWKRMSEEVLATVNEAVAQKP